MNKKSNSIIFKLRKVEIKFYSLESNFTTSENLVITGTNPKVLSQGLNPTCKINNSDLL